MERETEWRIAGPFVGPGESTHIINVRQQRPIAPRHLGEPLDRICAGKDVSTIPLDDFVPFGGGFGGQKWGYVRGEPGRIDEVDPPFGRGSTAHSFAEFLLWKPLYDQCDAPAFRRALSTFLAPSDEVSPL